MTDAQSQNAAQNSISEKQARFSVFPPLSKNIQVIFLFLLVTIIPATFFFSPHKQKRVQDIHLLTPDTVADATLKQSILEIYPSPIKTVFLIVMENQNWHSIKDASSASYINHILLPQASYTSEYYTPARVHPSEPNYIWMEAGSNLGITTNDPPAINHQSTTRHLTTMLDANGILWKSYQEGISGANCPLEDKELYAARHNPMVFFDDVTDYNNPDSVGCMIHIRPFDEFSQDMQNNRIGKYNFITPNLCHDMHNTIGCETTDPIKNGDTWLATHVPQILSSKAYKDGGVLFITWDEGENDSDGPIGMIALSPLAKGNGHVSTLKYTHSSLIRTLQEIFNVTPLLGDAANATDLSDLFISLASTPTPSPLLARAITPTPMPTLSPTPTPVPSTPTPTVTPQPTATSTPQPTPTPTPEIVAQQVLPSATTWSPYPSGSSIAESGFSFTYPQDWNVYYKQDTATGFLPLEFLFAKNNSSRAVLSMDIYPKAATVKEFIAKNFPQFADKLTITSFGAIGNKTLYQISPRQDVAANDLVNFAFGTHGVVLGSQQTYDVGFISGSRVDIDTIEKTVWQQFHFD